MLNLDKNLKYLLACSYGPDSMALFDMLEKEGYDFAVAHVNYHFRKESNVEETSLREYCLKHNKKLYVLNNTKKVSKNLEAEARNIRYEFFKTIINENSYDALVVAHHLDDLIETYLIQKNRKIRTNYFGIKDFSHNFDIDVYRPLLSIFKEDLLTYCDDNHVPYLIDSSNLSSDYLRNKIRHEQVEKMNKEEKLEMKRLIDEENHTIAQLIKSLNQARLHDVNYLLSLKSYYFDYAIYMIANEAQIFKISRDNINEFRRILLSKKPNILMSFKLGYFVKEYDRCYFLNSNTDYNYSYSLSSPGKLDTPYFYLDFTNEASNRNVKDSSYPLVIRNAHKDDQLKIKNYYKKVSRLFIDWKMPLSLRKRWPVIINKDREVIYIPRYQKDFVIEPSLNFYVK